VESRAVVAPRLSLADAELAIPLPQAASVPTATLRAKSGEDIPFHPNNDPDPAVEVSIPHLVLYRDGVLNPDPISRTLIVKVINIESPLARMAVAV